MAIKDELKKVLGVKEDQDLAKELGISKGAVSNWGAQGAPKYATLLLKYAGEAQSISEKDPIYQTTRNIQELTPDEYKCINTVKSDIRLSKIVNLWMNIADDDRDILVGDATRFSKLPQISLERNGTKG